MAVSPTLKIASIAVGAGGIVTGGAVGIHNYLSKSNEEGKKEDSATLLPEKDEKQTITPVQKSIAQSLPENKVLLVAEESNDQWNTNWGTFKTAYSQNHASDPLWTFSNWDELQRENENVAPQAFKDRCKTNGGKSRENNDKLFGEIQKYCTKDKSSG
ncbi:hypothetical protein A6V39_01185 [Candidatus Mycoplasma haematobovis]|uniref:Uncharacterized protein n=1 Tax=Candidatus Mycoplasma haematobovis TaxID=432608 RepID=A0A1A9QDW9_9MOLU|nr:hypothetical protein [Candidatus Mycoplasma haematobovis]OAL10667.1 hypothetical protein A6V39_01185 [Candidatus Mycoplasma haematobovis]